MTTTDADTSRALLRHTLATLAYRAAKPLRDAPPHYAAFRAAPDSRSPAELVAHMSDLFDWALSIAQGQQRWASSTPGEWPADVARFFATLQAFDDFLASDAVLHETPGKLFQGPVADALTHTGQLTMLRRLAGDAIRAENYHAAQIATGRVTSDQVSPRREFD